MAWDGGGAWVRGRREDSTVCWMTTEWGGVCVCVCFTFFFSFLGWVGRKALGGALGDGEGSKEGGGY